MGYRLLLSSSGMLTEIHMYISNYCFKLHCKVFKSPAWTLVARKVPLEEQSTSFNVRADFGDVKAHTIVQIPAKC